MRLRKADLRARINGNLEFRFAAPGLTSYAGLELVRRYLSTIGFAGDVRRVMRDRVPGNDFGLTGMILLLLALLISGGRRVRHVLYLDGDPVIQRCCGLRRFPTPRTVGRWLREFRAHHLPWVQELNAQLVARVIAQTKLRRLTIDVDGSVVSTGLQVEWAQRGYNPHRRKVPSYYPITAYEAQSGQILRVQNRPGNVHDGKGAIQFMRSLFEQLAATLPGRLLEFRMDGAFFRRDVIELLESHGAEYAIKVPFYPWVGLKEKVRQTVGWVKIDDSVSCATHVLSVARWQRAFRVVVFRKRVNHKTAKNFQLDLFDPADGHYEYSAVVTNKDLQGAALWQFMCGRGSHEKAYAELKSGFAFDCVPTMKYAANSLWQILSVMAFNIVRGFQTLTATERRASSRKRRTLHRFETVHTLRYLCLHRAGVIVRPDGYAILDVGNSSAVVERFKRLDRLLDAA